MAKKQFPSTVRWLVPLIGYWIRDTINEFNPFSIPLVTIYDSTETYREMDRIFKKIPALLYALHTFNERVEKEAERSDPKTSSGRLKAGWLIRISALESIFYTIQTNLTTTRMALDQYPKLEKEADKLQKEAFFIYSRLADLRRSISGQNHDFRKLKPKK